MAVAPEAVHLIEDEADLDALDTLDADTPVALLAQTTLSHDEWRGLMEAALERFPELWLPDRSDLCFATTNRQAALREIAGKVDAVVVIGSANSSNTVALEKVASASGCPRVIRVDGADEVPADLAGTVGVTAGASAPEQLVQAGPGRARPDRGGRAGPRDHRGRVLPAPARAARAAAGLGHRRSPCWPAAAEDPAERGPSAGDRGVSAADVLDALAS